MSGLLGKRVVVTRAREQADGICTALAARGAEPILFPTIVTLPVASLDAAPDPLASYDWVLFTSANGVRFFVDRFEISDATAWPPGVRVAAVGLATARALEARGLPVHAVPHEYRAEALATALGELRDQRLLLPRADLGGRDLVDALASAGAVAHELVLYHTVPAEPDPEGLAALRTGVDAVTFTSPSTVRNFLAMLGDEGRTLLEGVVIATIGPVTSKATEAEGIRVDVQPDDYTVDALVEALARHVAVGA